MSNVFAEPCEACGVSEWQLGVDTERERIIKLLDELHESKNQSHHITNRSGVCVTCRAIALIKAGE